MKAVLLFVFMPWVDASCTCKYFDEGGTLMVSKCSCGEWTGSTCTSGGDGLWTDCVKISNQDDCASAENNDGQQFCKWEEPETCDDALASARDDLGAAEEALAQCDGAKHAAVEALAQCDEQEEPETDDWTLDAALQQLDATRKDLDAAEAALAQCDGANVAKYSAAVERSECLAGVGGSCATCCQDITGKCQDLTVDGGGRRNERITTLTDDDDCVLIEGRFNKIYVTFPRLKLSRLFFSSAWRVGIRRRRRDCRQGHL